MSQNPSLSSLPPLHPSTLAIHADSHLSPVADMAPPLHVSTNYRYPPPPQTPTHIYTRVSAPTTSRLEATLGALLHGETAVYPSGLAAFHALLVHTRPRRLLMTRGYHGTQGTAALFSRLTGMEVVEFEAAAGATGATGATGTEMGLREGDLVHLETPANPTGVASDVAGFAAAAHAAGALLSVDATFAPPPLQDPFACGADFVLHSASKYFGGHSDMLGGTLSAARPADADRLRADRLLLGATMGNLEAWLGLRSVKTLELRVVRQSAGAGELVRWVVARLRGAAAGDAVAAVVERVEHASLQEGADGWVKRQMPGGYGPVFALVMKSEAKARALPEHLVLWGHATSLGGVESSIEWRAMSDVGCDRRLLRLSVGVEDVRDLKADLERAFEAVLDV